MSVFTPWHPFSRASWISESAWRGGGGWRARERDTHERCVGCCEGRPAASGITGGLWRKAGPRRGGASHDRGKGCRWIYVYDKRTVRGVLRVRQNRAGGRRDFGEESRSDARRPERESIPVETPSTATPSRAHPSPHHPRRSGVEFRACSAPLGEAGDAEGCCGPRAL